VAKPLGHPNVFCTPHLGASTREAQENVALQVAEQMSDDSLDRRDLERGEFSVDHGRRSERRANLDG
jgi:phosphoglycerate dehydrogenase-like enzyme